MKSFTGKKVFITGASAGLGAILAKQCAKKGADLALFARRLDRLEGLKEALESKYQVHVRIYSLDIAEHEKVSEVFKQALREMGGIDCLVNNAGYGIFRHASDLSVSEVKRMFDVNVIGLIACTSAVLPFMQEQGAGHIINIASQAGKIATPKSSAYAATKHAVLGYTNSLRLELANQGVQVTSVNPGPIATDFFATADESGTYVKNVSRYLLKPAEVANAITEIMFTNTRELNLPRWMHVGSVIYAVFPRLFERLGRKAFNKK